MTNKKTKQTPPTPTVSQQKMWLWVQQCWATCPTNYELNEWYNLHSQALLDMYTSYKNEESTNTP